MATTRWQLGHAIAPPATSLPTIALSRASVPHMPYQYLGTYYVVDANGQFLMVSVLPDADAVKCELQTYFYVVTWSSICIEGRIPSSIPLQPVVYEAFRIHHQRRHRHLGFTLPRPNTAALAPEPKQGPHDKAMPTGSPAAAASVSCQNRTNK